MVKRVDYVAEFFVVHKDYKEVKVLGRQKNQYLYGTVLTHSEWAILCGPFGSQEEAMKVILSLPYTIELIYGPIPADGWFVSIKEWEGCMSQEDSLEAAVTAIRDAQALWLEAALEDKFPVPAPEGWGPYRPAKKKGKKHGK